MTADYLSYSLHSMGISSLSISLAVFKHSVFPYLTQLSSLNHLLVLWLQGKYLNCLILSFLFYKMGIKVVPSHRYHKNISTGLSNILILFELCLLGFLKIYLKIISVFIISVSPIDQLSFFIYYSSLILVQFI